MTTETTATQRAEGFLKDLDFYGDKEIGNIGKEGRSIITDLLQETERLEKSEPLLYEYQCHIEAVETELNTARMTAEMWKAEHLAGNERITELERELSECKAKMKDLDIEYQKVLADFENMKGCYSREYNANQAIRQQTALQCVEIANKIGFAAVRHQEWVPADNSQDECDNIAEAIKTQFGITS